MQQNLSLDTVGKNFYRAGLCALVFVNFWAFQVQAQVEPPIKKVEAPPEPAMGALVVEPISAMEAASPLGYWKTIDDKTKKPKAIVQITQEGDQLRGKIVKLFPREGRPDNPVCDKCKGDKKDKPILGLEILWNLKKDSEIKWDSGDILDPESGSVYSAKAELQDQGMKLKVRGFLGFSLLGRTQVWERALDYTQNQ